MEQGIITQIHYHLTVVCTGGNVVNTQSISSGNSAGQVRIKAGETVKFVAHSIDVNHGFGVLSSSNQMDSPLMQMQVVPGFDNVFYYTFNKPGTYTIRCLDTAVGIIPIWYR